MLSVDLANAVKFSMCKLAVAPDASNVFVAKNSLSNRRKQSLVITQRKT